MSLSEILEELPAFTFEERQLLVRRVIELDDPPLSADDESLVESRLAAHHINPTSSVPLAKLKQDTTENGSDAFEPSNPVHRLHRLVYRNLCHLWIEK